MANSQETGMSVMGREVHPTVAAQIKNSWDTTIPRLKIREEILSEPSFSKKEIALLISGLHLGAPLALIELWRKEILETKTNPDPDKSTDVLVEKYSKTLIYQFPHSFPDLMLDDSIDSDS